jgi:hypothetical protein
MYSIIVSLDPLLIFLATCTVCSIEIVREVDRYAAEMLLALQLLTVIKVSQAFRRASGQCFEMLFSHTLMYYKNGGFPFAMLM